MALSSRYTEYLLALADQCPSVSTAGDLPDAECVAQLACECPERGHSREAGAPEWEAASAVAVAAAAGVVGIVQE
jgi:hypothetical protein